MSRALLIAEKYNTDQDRILASVIPVIQYTSDALRANLASMLESGKRFGIKGYLITHLQGQLATIMLTGHFAGMRRASLDFQQKPRSLYLSHDALELSVFSEVLGYVKRKMSFDINSLQKQYDTLALKVLSSASDDINNELEKTVQGLISDGAHVRDAKKILGAKFDQLGLRPASKSQLETIFRTQTQIAFAAGKYRAERETDYIKDALWGYKYVTTGDDRVRQSHRVLDGVTLPKEHPFWEMFYPPNGWNCRCQAVPLFEPHTAVFPPTELDGNPLMPDKGFNWSAGHIFNPILAS